jgi:hypothetical protein
MPLTATIARRRTLLSGRMFTVVSRIAALPELKAAVEANHDDNRWWPRSVADPRMRMLVAGWSTRVSYAMVDTYAHVVTQAAAIGFDRITRTQDETLVGLVRPIGLPAARLAYLRSLTVFLARLERDAVDPLTADVDAIIGRFAAEVHQASFKVAQCAILYARGYHCGIIPVDSGMVTKLAPVLGICLPAGPIAHEHMRLLLQACVADRADDYRHLARVNGHQVVIPAGATPTWWVHLVLIYFKRLYLNRPQLRLCAARPVCDVVVDCRHAGRLP